MKIDSRIPLCLTSNTTATSLPQRKSVLLRSHYTMNGPKNHGGEHSFQREPQSNSGGDNYFAASGVSAATASRDDFKILAASLITGLVNTLDHLLNHITLVIACFVGHGLEQELKKIIRGTARAIEQLLYQLTKEAEKYYAERSKVWKKVFVGPRLTEAVERFSKWYRNAVVGFPFFRFIDSSNRWWLMFTIGYLVVYLFAVVCMAVRGLTITA